MVSYLSGVAVPVIASPGRVVETSARSRVNDHMSTNITESKETLEAAWTRFLEGETEALDEVYDDDVRYEDPSTELTGLDAVKEYLQVWPAAFPDFEIEIHEQVAERDTVATYFTARGTHEGEFQGIPPTGNTFEGPGVTVDHLEDGMVVEEINVWDNQTLFEQLEIDPAEL